MTNPLLEQDDLPMFGAIKPEHVGPAIDLVLADNRAQIDALSAMNDLDYDGFAGVLELLGDRLAKTWSPVSHLNSVCNAPALRLAFNACLPKLTQYWTEMGQNDRLFAGYKALRGRAALSAEETKVVADAVRDFRLAGVELSGDARTRYGAIALRLSELTAKYSENLLDATDAWHKSLPEADLRGLPETALASARAAGAARGDSACVISLEQPSYVAVMTYAEDRALRREVYEAYMTRASERGPSASVYDNGAIMDEILSLRHEMAALLGFASFAGLSLATKMAQTPAQVLAFLRGLASKSLPAARQELDALQTFARDELGIADLSAWDSAFASERLRQARYAVSQELLRPYFPVGRVLDGMFEIVRRIYGIDVVEVAGPEVWHPSVRAFEVRRAGLLVGQFFLDAYARENKRGGAWMDECRVRRRARDGLQLPVAYLVCNFTAPLGDRPALTPVESFYQRILASDADEALDHAEVLLKTTTLTQYYDTVALKGLQMAARDSERGVLRPAQLGRIRKTIGAVVDDLASHAEPASRGERFQSPRGNERRYLCHTRHGVDARLRHLHEGSEEALRSSQGRDLPDRRPGSRLLWRRRALHGRKDLQGVGARSG